jgi:hypothetical protein
MSLRQSSSAFARLFLLGRHGRERAVRVVRERLHDVLLLLVALAIALVIRGVPRHQVIGGLEDAGWAALAVALYLPIVFVVGAVAAARSLSRWDVSHTPIVQGTPVQNRTTSEHRSPQRWAELGSVRRVRRYRYAAPRADPPRRLEQESAEAVGRRRDP